MMMRGASGQLIAQSKPNKHELAMPRGFVVMGR
jgi:hypothetical protein